LVFVQATVGERHSVKLPKLREVHTRALQLLGIRKLDMLLLFATDNRGIHTIQNIVDANSHVCDLPSEFQRMEQHSLIFGDEFTALGRSWYPDIKVR